MSDGEKPKPRKTAKSEKAVLDLLEKLTRKNKELTTTNDYFKTKLGEAEYYRETLNRMKQIMENDKKLLNETTNKLTKTKQDLTEFKEQLSESRINNNERWF